MHIRSTFCALIAGVSMLVTVHAEPPQRAPARGSLPPPALLNAMVTWLAVHFDLPKNFSYPAIRLEPGRKITTFRYTGMLSDHPRDTADVPRGQREVVAAYDSLTRTIYLPEGWNGNTPKESSMLVHEMVHHLQNVGGLRYECPQASEQLAYAAQEKWLSLFGRSLAQDFEIDAFTLLVTTRCGP